MFEDLVVKNQWGGGAPEDMTFPHCHQLYGGFIKYRLGVILVLTYLKAHSMGSVCRGCERDPRGC